MSLLIMPSTGAYTKTSPRRSKSVYSFNKKTDKQGEKEIRPSSTKKKTKLNPKPKPPPRPRKAKKAPTKFGKKTSKTDKPKVDKKKRKEGSTMKLTPRKPDKKAAIIYILSSQDFSPGCGCRQRNMIL